MKRYRLVFLSIFLLFSSFLWAQDTVLQPVRNETKGDYKGSPVIVSGDTVFFIYSSYGEFSADERASRVADRLIDIIRQPKFYPDSLKVNIYKGDYYIAYHSNILFAVGDDDADYSGLSKEAYADFVSKKLEEYLGEKSKSFNFWFLIKNIAYTLLVLVVLSVIIRLLNWVFRKIFHYVATHREKLFKSIVFNNYEFLNAEREYQLAKAFLRIAKIGLIILFFLIALPVIFSIFPATKGITLKILGMIWGPVRNILMSVVNYIPSLITIVVIFIVFRYLVRFIRYLTNEIEQGVLVLSGFHPEWAKPTYNIIRVLLYAFMFVVIFPYLPGSDSPVFQGVSVFLGVLLSLGSSSLISNAMAGMVITYMRPYKIGDRIKVDDVVGDVVEKTLMITRIKTIKNEDITIPNAKILTGYTVNYTTPTEREGLIIHTTVTIGYDAPWRTVHELLIRAAVSTEGVTDYPRPFVLHTSLDDFYISYQVNAFIKDSHAQARIKSHLHQNIQDGFNHAGIEIMSPHYRAERDGNPVTIPDEEEIVLPPVKETPAKEENPDIVTRTKKDAPDDK